jgi:hypothetical protein
MIKGKFIRKSTRNWTWEFRKEKEIIAKIEVLATEKSMHIPNGWLK